MDEGTYTGDEAATADLDPPTEVEDHGDDAALARQRQGARRVRPTTARSGFGSGDGSHGASGSAHDSTAATVSPVEAMHLEEVHRTRKFLVIVYMFCLVIPASLPFLGGSNPLKLLLTGCCALCALVGARLHWVIRDPAAFDQRQVNVVAFISVITAYAGVFFWGVFSVAPAIVVMGLYFFSRSGSIAAATFVYALCAGLQAALSIMILAGVFEDPGLFPKSDRPLLELVLTQIILQFIFLCTYLIARWARRTTIDVIDRLQTAMQQVAQREALLHEARHDLDAALRVSGAGRYSEQTVGAYKLGSVLGRGAMGEVYDAVHVESGEPAAVKLLHANVLASPSHVARFLRESEVIGQLESPHVVRVLARSDADEPVPYLAMERLWGENLAYHLRAKRRLTLEQLVKLANEVGSVIDLARPKGIVHRDLKPQNLLLHKPLGANAAPLWKILDFGVSKLGHNSGTLTQGHVVGTPVYMAPEQARGEAVDYRADLYALAAVCYRCLTGRPPFTGRDVPAILYNVVYTMPPQPSKLVKLHADVDYVLAVGLAKDPADRFDDSVDLATGLELAAEGRLDEVTRNQGRLLLSRHPWNAPR